MTRQEARTLIRKELGETTAAFWTDAELNTWINLAGHVIAQEALCIRSKGFVTTIEDQAEYDMDTLFTGFLCPTKVYMYQDATTWQEIDRLNLEEMNFRYPGWKSADSGTPFLYFFEQDRGRILTLYVKPDETNAGTNYLEVYYAKDFVDVSADGTDIGSQLTHTILELALVDWVVATGFDSRNMLDKSADRWARFNGKIVKYHRDIKNKLDEDEDILMKPYRTR
jgi:hypothetical protein